MTYAKFISETQVDTNVPKSGIVNGQLIIGKLPASYLATLGFYPLIESSQLLPLSGYHMEARYRFDSGNKVIIKYWEQVKDEPIESHRTYSKLKMVAGFIREGVWEMVKATIEEAGLYDLFLAAQDFKDDNEFFNQGKSVLQDLLGWTNEEVETFLNECLLD